MGRFVLYLFTVCTAFACTYAVLPGLSHIFGKYLLDRPGGLKKHTNAVPVLGGCGIFAGLLIALFAIRFTTQFPSGTLHSLRGILLGGSIIFIMGLWDDLKKPQGLPIWSKLLLQAVATVCLIRYGIVIHAISPVWISYPLTFLWVVGLTNAFNLLDIMDGLCTTQSLVCTLGLFIISLPSEFIYVNFAALALLGAGAGFLPFNFSVKDKIFLGDSGSNLLGFLIASLGLATSYSYNSSWGFLAPLLIVFLPIADISFVSFARLLGGKNPLKGSADHAALRLQANGWGLKYILAFFTLAGLLCNVLAFMVTICAPGWVLPILAIPIIAAVVWAKYLLTLGESHAR